MGNTSIVGPPTVRIDTELLSTADSFAMFKNDRDVILMATSNGRLLWIDHEEMEAVSEKGKSGVIAF